MSLKSARRVLGRFIALLLSIGTASITSAGTITYDFESLADQEILTNQFPGVVFSGAYALSAGVSLSELDYPPHSGSIVISDYFGPMSVSFASPVASVLAYLTYIQPVTLTAFDLSDNVLATRTSTYAQNFLSSGNPSNELVFVSVRSSTISRVVFSGDPSGGTFVLDDLQVIDAQVVPEPGTMMVVFGALLLFGLLRKFQ